MTILYWTRSVYEAYRKAGYSKTHYEAYWEELTLHNAAKEAFEESGRKKIPGIKKLNEEYAELLTAKKQAYAEYRLVREEAQELAIAERNILELYEAEKKEMSKEYFRKKMHWKERFILEKALAEYLAICCAGF